MPPPPLLQAKLNLATRLRYALDAAKGMVFLHQHRIIHRDLKSSNLLIANDRLKTVRAMPRVCFGACDETAAQRYKRLPAAHANASRS